MKKRLMALTLAAAMCVSMAACGSSNSGSSSSADSKGSDLTYSGTELGKDTDLKANITVFNHRTDMSSDDYGGTTWKEYIAAFNKEYPNIKVTVTTDTNYADDALTHLQSGDYETVMMIPAVDKSDLSTYFMPFPMTVNGKQYAAAGADYSYGINVHASDTEKKAALIFVKWMTDESQFSYNEDGLPVTKKDDSTKLDFKGVDIEEDEPALDGEEDYLNDMNSESELNINNGGNDKVQAIIEHASKGDESFDDIMKEWNKKWSDAQDANGIEVKY